MYLFVNPLGVVFPSLFDAEFAAAGCTVQVCREWTNGQGRRFGAQPAGRGRRLTFSRGAGLLRVWCAVRPDAG
jgi:hypothetical protein